MVEDLKTIESFTIDHNKLLRGLYVSRKDNIKDVILTTFDIRMKEPNREAVLNNAELHTIEHLGATYLRNNEEWKERIVYFGPMGCRTGFYLILAGDYSSKDALTLVKDTFEWISKFEGDIPGALAVECGNYLDQNLTIAKLEAKKYLEILNNAKDENLEYPE